MRRTGFGVGRGVAVVGIVGFVLVGASPVGASPDDWWFGRSGVMIRGAAASETPGGHYGLGVYARNNGAPDEACACGMRARQRVARDFRAEAVLPRHAALVSELAATGR